MKAAGRGDPWGLPQSPEPLEKPPSPRRPLPDVEVLHIDIPVWSRLPLAPQQQPLLGRSLCKKPGSMAQTPLAQLHGGAEEQEMGWGGEWPLAGRACSARESLTHSPSLVGVGEQQGGLRFMEFQLRRDHPVCPAAQPRPENLIQLPLHCTRHLCWLKHFRPQETDLL